MGLRFLLYACPLWAEKLNLAGRSVTNLHAESVFGLFIL
jgi:hypothetical protein